MVIVGRFPRIYSGLQAPRCHRMGASLTKLFSAWYGAWGFTGGYYMTVDALFIEHPSGYKRIECRLSLDLVSSINRINHTQATRTTFAYLQRLSVPQINTFKMSPWWVFWGPLFQHLLGIFSLLSLQRSTARSMIPSFSSPSKVLIRNVTDNFQ